jgi:hypothetical protein
MGGRKDPAKDIMATNMPSTIPELISWCNVHSNAWTVNAAAIGLSPAQATAFTTLCSNFSKANDTAQAARENSKFATNALKDAMNAVQVTGGAYINLIKAYAETTYNANVYNLAQVSPANPPGTVPEPVAPQQFGATVNANGSLTINWKVAQPTGTTGVQYRVYRRVNSTTNEYTLVSTEGSKKSYTDENLPYGVDMVQYIVQPVRSSVVGPMSPAFTVQFGSVMGGGMSIARIDTTQNVEPMKIAA